MLAFFALLIIAILCVSAEKPTARVVLCQSVDCEWNSLCRCTRQRIGITDALIKGVCVYHTQDMKDRILKPPPTRKAVMGCGVVDENMLDKIMELQDEKLLKDPDAFDKWMKMNLRTRRKR